VSWGLFDVPQVSVDDYELDLKPWQEQRRQSPTISFALSLHLHSDSGVGKTPQISAVHPDIRAAASVSVEISTELAIGRMITGYALSVLVPKTVTITDPTTGRRSTILTYAKGSTPKILDKNSEAVIGWTTVQACKLHF
jgi:hypothetical protein